MTTNQIYAALILFVLKDGDILTSSRRNDPNNIGLIGGKLKPGETPEHAACREAKEETSVIVEEADLEFILDRMDREGRLVRVFAAKKWAGSPRAMENGIKIRWESMYALAQPSNTYGTFNRALFAHLGFTFEYTSDRIHRDPATGLLMCNDELTPAAEAELNERLVPVEKESLEALYIRVMSRLPEKAETYTVRLWDGMDGCWNDCYDATKVTLDKALEVWAKQTKNGTQKTEYAHIDYYAIFPANTRMVYDGSGPDGEMFR